MSQELSNDYKDIDWEKRRYEISKDILTNSVSKDLTPLDSISHIDVKYAIDAADELINQLKQQSNEQY